MPAFKQAPPASSRRRRPLLAGALVAVASVLLAEVPAAAQSPSLSVSKSGPLQPVEVGEAFAYTIRVSNTGTGPATEVVVEDDLPPEVRLVSASPAPSCEEDGKAGMLTCRLGSVDPGATVEVIIDVVAEGAARVENAVTVSSAELPDVSATAATELCHVAGGSGHDVLTATDPSGQRICGGGGRDLLVGGDGPDVLVGGPGRDRLEGGGGGDVLEGEAGMDVLLGGPGNDVLRGGDGPDYLDGGEGDDALEPGAGVNTCAEQAQPPQCYPPSPDDADDVRGRLDVRQVRTSFSESFARWTIVTSGSWGVRYLWDRGYFMVLLDTSGTAREDYRVVVRSNGRRMIGTLFRGAKRVTGLRVRRDDGNIVWVRVPLSELKVGRGLLRWRLVTQFSGKVCRGDWCLDPVPDEGPLLQPV